VRRLNEGGVFRKSDRTAPLDRSQSGIGCRGVADARSSIRCSMPLEITTRDPFEPVLEPSEDSQFGGRGFSLSDLRRRVNAVHGISRGTGRRRRVRDGRAGQRVNHVAGCSGRGDGSRFGDGIRRRPSLTVLPGTD